MSVHHAMQVVAFFHHHRGLARTPKGMDVLFHALRVLMKWVHK